MATVASHAVKITNDMSALARSLRQAENAFDTTVRKCGRKKVAIAADDVKYKSTLTGLTSWTEKQGSTMGRVFKGAFAIGMGLGVLQGVKSLTGGITDLVNTAARTQTLNAALEAVAHSTGNNIANINKQKESMRDLGIAEQESTTMLMRFMQAQLDVAQASKLARVAQDAAVIAGMNSSQAAEQMTAAIARQSPVLLDAFGMTKNLNDIYGEYARTMGTKAKNLSEFGKQQAMLNYILGEGQKIAGTYEASMGTVGKKTGSLKRLYDTLKNAIATPLALPLTGMIVDGVTNALKNAVTWAEANQSTLASWGMTLISWSKTAYGAIMTVVNGFMWLIGVIRQHWEAIRFAVTVWASYIAMTKTAALITGIFAGASALLKGELLSKIPILSGLSTVMGIYRVQMALAAAQGVATTGVMFTLRTALWSVYAALGPVGWAMLALSAAVGVGMYAWNRYNNSLSQNKIAAVQAQKTTAKATKAVGGATGAINKQSKALKKNSKAIQENIQGWDELHKLQKAAAGSGLDEGLGGTGGGGGFDAPGIGMPAMPDLGGMYDDMMGESVSFWDDWKAGWKIITDWFGQLWADWKAGWGIIWDWIKSTAGSLWDGIKGAWSSFKTWTGGMWDTIKDKWNAFKAWIGEKWDAFKTWAGTKFASIASTVSNFFGGAWSTIRTKWQDFRAWVSLAWDNFKTFASTKVGGIATAISNAFSGAWAAAKNTWNAFKAWIGTTWDNFKAWASNKFSSIGSGIANAWSKAIGGISNAIKGVINGLIVIMNKFIGYFNKIKFTIPKITIPYVGTVGGQTYGVPQIPNIPYLAKGGLIDRPTLAMVGEGNETEAVAPLSKLTSFIDDAVKKAMGTGSGQSSNDGPIQITLMLDGNILGKVTARSLKELQRQSGPIPILS